MSSILARQGGKQSDAARRLRDGCARLAPELRRGDLAKSRSYSVLHQLALRVTGQHLRRPQQPLQSESSCTSPRTSSTVSSQFSRFHGAWCEMWQATCHTYSTLPLSVSEGRVQRSMVGVCRVRHVSGYGRWRSEPAAWAVFSFPSAPESPGPPLLLLHLRLRW
jgi:hypothetical protein